MNAQTAEMYWNTKIVPRIPAVQGGIITEEGEELYTTNQEVTGIFRNMQGILKAVEQGVRIFVPITIMGMPYHPHSGEQVRDEVVVFQAAGSDAGGGVIGFLGRNLIITFNASVPFHELHEMWQPAVRQALAQIKAESD